MRNALDALLAGKPVPVATTKTFGCSIKWADKREYAKKDAEKRNSETAELDLIDAPGDPSAHKKRFRKNSVSSNIWATWCGPLRSGIPGACLYQSYVP